MASPSSNFSNNGTSMDRQIQHPKKLREAVEYWGALMGFALIGYKAIPVPMKSPSAVTHFQLSN